MFFSIVKTKELHDNIKKTWMTFYLFKEFFSFSKRSIANGILQIDHHLLILDGHVSHLTSKTIEQAQAFVLNTGTLPSHTSHKLQTLNLLFQTIQNNIKKKVKIKTMVINNHLELNKMMLCIEIGYAKNKHTIQDLIIKCED